MFSSISGCVLLKTYRRLLANRGVGEQATECFADWALQLIDKILTIVRAPSSKVV